MSSVKIEWYGEEIKKAVLDACEEAVNEAAELVLKKAQALCPVETMESVARRTGKVATDSMGRKILDSSGRLISGNVRVSKYGAASGALKKSGRIVRFRKKGVVGAYVQFGGIKVDRVDTYYGAFVELGTPGTKFRTKTGYWGKKAKQRVSVLAKPFLRPALKSSRAKIRNLFKAKLEAYLGK